ncbi:MAG: Rrf2 family transcriptional regulator [Polynucleobacter sp.]|nr:MAG: Rrf2 family transcriptional regulator [Polynucleobacter sp.]
MQLTQWTDYSLRVLMYCAKNSDRDTPITIMEILERHQISKSHLTKIVSFLSNTGYLKTTRGRNGGISIARPPRNISVGEVVRMTESNFEIVECFNKKTNSCSITSTCKLKHLLQNATNAFISKLDQVTLDQIC